MFRAGESRSLCFVAERLCVCIRRGACQETPFPTESQDGLNEEMELVLVQTPVGDICIACTTTHQRGFSYIPIEQIPQALSESEIMFNRFFQGRNFVIGASGRYWGEENAQRTVFVSSFMDTVYEGWDLQGFKDQNHNIDPSAMGVQPYPGRDKITGAPINVYFMPKKGPICELRVRSGHGAEWASGMMPHQIYAEQGADLVEHARTTHVNETEYMQCVMPRETFYQKLENERVKNGQGASHGTSSSPSGGGGGTAAAPVSWRPCASPAAIRVVPPQISAPSASAMQPPRAVAFTPVFKGVKSKLNQVNAARTSVITPRQPARVGCKPAEMASQAAAKRPFIPVKHELPETPRSSHHDSSSPAVKIPRKMGMVGATNLTEAGLMGIQTLASSNIPSLPASARAIMCKDGAASDISSFTAASKGCKLSGDKYSRAIEAASLTACLQGVNMNEKYTNLRKQSTAAKTSGHTEAFKAVNEHILCMDAACALVWDRTMECSWEVVKTNAIKIHTKMESFPKGTMATVVARWAMQVLPPTTKVADWGEFFNRLGMWKPSNERIQDTSINFEEPSFVSHPFTESDAQTICAQAFEKVIFDVAAIPVLRKKGSGVTELLQMCTTVVNILTRYPEAIQASPIVKRALSKARCVIFIKGKYPFMSDSKISDVELVQDLPDEDQFAKELRENDLWKPCMSSAFTYNVSEGSNWPKISKLLKDFAEGLVDVKIIEDAMNMWPKWERQMRDSVLNELRGHLLKQLQEKLNAADFSTIDSSEADQLRDFVKVAKKAYVKLGTQDLFQALQKADEFNRKFSEKDMALRVLKTCKEIADGVPPEDLLVKALEISRELPGGADVKITVLDLETATHVVTGMERIVDAATGRFPNGQSEITAVLKAKKIIVFDGEACKDRVDPFTKVCKSAMDLETLLALNQRLTEYTKLGTHAEERVKADTKSEGVKALIKCSDAMGKITLSDTMHAALSKITDVKLLCADASRCIREHGDSKVQMAKQSLETALSKLSSVCKGSADSESWKKNLADDCTYEQLMQSAAVLEQTVRPARWLVDLKGIKQAGMRN